MKYKIFVCFKNDNCIDFVCDKYYHDSDVYIFTSTSRTHIISCDTVKYITIDKLNLV